MIKLEQRESNKAIFKLLGEIQKQMSAIDKRNALTEQSLNNLEKRVSGIEK